MGIRIRARSGTPETASEDDLLAARSDARREQAQQQMASGSPAGPQPNGSEAPACAGTNPAGFESATAESMVGIRKPSRALHSSIRLMHEGDLPWLAQMCRKRYSYRYDQEGTEGWFRNIVLKAPLLFYPARTDNAFTITMLSCVPWLPAEWAADVVFTCADDGAMWEVVSLLRRSIEWARARRASIWRIMSDTEYDVSALARRMGASAVTPRYVLRL